MTEFIMSFFTNGMYPVVENNIVLKHRLANNKITWMFENY